MRQANQNAQRIEGIQARLGTLSSSIKGTRKNRRIGTNPHTKELLERNKKAIDELKNYS
ncbi:hypothetical protein [Priestia megaterium]|uniref:hypothetical protein n=1 Tax=Priestia megaterium TaxID=1404 RepID=UPI002FFE6E99